MVLYDLAVNRNYGDMREELIRDRLVVGIRDNAKLQLDATLTLETVKKSIRQREAVRKQQQTLKRAENPASPVGSVSAIGNKRPNFRGTLDVETKDKRSEISQPARSAAAAAENAIRGTSALQKMHSATNANAQVTTAQCAARKLSLRCQALERPLGISFG